MRRVIKQDLGQYPEELFQRIDPVPIASASLAQVHIAYDKEGNKLAIKCQHEGTVLPTHRPIPICLPLSTYPYLHTPIYLPLPACLLTYCFGDA